MRISDGHEELGLDGEEFPSPQSSPSLDGEGVFLPARLDAAMQRSPTKMARIADRIQECWQVSLNISGQLYVLKITHINSRKSRIE